MAKKITYQIKVAGAVLFSSTDICVAQRYLHLTKTSFPSAILVEA